MDGVRARVRVRDTGRGMEPCAGEWGTSERRGLWGSRHVRVVRIELNAHPTRVRAAKGARTDICTIREQDIQGWRENSDPAEGYFPALRRRRARPT
mmetsp:Transcript_2576/g.9363  ORF Transcript_2576/g.9363 Transcript_2576/m.9363 type:complete len:96 (-) Transcript_2576:1099-1386(-)